MTVRVYVPLTRAQLERLVDDRVLPAPLPAHAVTAALRAAWPDGDQEQWEYAAMAAAAVDALCARPADDPPRRLVVAADADAVTEGEGTAVTLAEGLTWARVAALHADAEDLPAGLLDDPETAAEEDLPWFARQEVDGVLRDLR